ncbi:HAD family hydrolase [Fulvivirga lutea]|uniref:HAD-IA family hydrolase n=1 Tax=Fulvivirga lutea TaxID=2810512 RepID=A0A974WI80_9BACT|nr:HAD-IA family hydrolase [Fulvivirga lutea]QSE96605.1 HAD-IA family hydrolase [Fulvivirga lutea]
MKFKHIIFDCDGVLVDSEIVAAEVMAPVLSTFGLSITVKHYLANYTGKTFRHIFEQFKIDQRVDIDMLIKNVEERVYSDIRPVDGIVEVVKSIELPKSVVSNSGLSQIKHAVESVELSEQFLFQFSSSQVSMPKPSPEVYLYASKKLELKPQDCLVIEDSISGCTAALEAGMTVIGFCGGKHITPKHKVLLKELGVHDLALNSKELNQKISKMTKSESV